MRTDKLWPHELTLTTRPPHRAGGTCRPVAVPAVDATTSDSSPWPRYDPSAALSIAQPPVEVSGVHASFCRKVLDKGRHGHEHILPVAD